VRILVVEDHPKTAALLERGLRENFYDVDVAKTGEDAVRLESTKHYDAVVLDLMLPDIDGSEVLRRIRSGGSTVPVLVVTAHGSEESKALGRNVGADDYLQKPFTFDALLTHLRVLTASEIHQPDISCPSCGSGKLSVPYQNATDQERLVRAIQGMCPGCGTWFEFIYDAQGTWNGRPPRRVPE
jgi:DNA-binding response OmpR family regulator